MSNHHGNNRLHEASHLQANHSLLCFILHTILADSGWRISLKNRHGPWCQRKIVPILTIALQFIHLRIDAGVVGIRHGIKQRRVSAGDEMQLALSGILDLDGDGLWVGAVICHFDEILGFGMRGDPVDCWLRRKEETLINKVKKERKGDYEDYIIPGPNSPSELVSRINCPLMLEKSSWT